MKKLIKEIEELKDKYSGSIHSKDYGFAVDDCLTLIRKHEAAGVDDIYKWIDKHLYMKEHAKDAFVMGHSDVYELVRLVKKSDERPADPVDLEACAKAGMLACQVFYNKWNGEDAMDVHLHVVKAVLSAANVKWKE